MSIQFISTDVGRAKLAQSGMGNVTLAKIGVSAVNSTVTENSTALPNEIKQIPISGQSIDGTHLHFAFADNSNDNYIARAIGLYLADGTLFAIHSQAAPIFEKSAGNLQHVSMDLILVDLVNTNIVFPDTKVSNPPATTSISGVVELATNAETRTGTDAIRAITPANLKDYIDWRISEGINAARLGGQLPSYYTDIIARLGFAPLPASALNGVWTNQNDGPNSGLSADKLWDLSPDDLAKTIDFNSSKLSSGHQKLPGGLIFQWTAGQIDPPGLEGAQQFVAFPITFPNACLFAICGTEIGIGTSASNIWYQNIGKPTLSGIAVERQVAGGAVAYDITPTTPLVFAIGY